MEELEATLRKLKSEKACGPDRITNEFLKNLPTSGKIHLLSALNVILESGEVPEGWVDAEIFLLFKKGEPSDPDNYRGILLLNVIFNVLTQILVARLNS